MAVNQIWISQSWASNATKAWSYRAQLYYDTVAQAILLQCDNGTAGTPGDGSAELDLFDNRTGQMTPIAAIDCAQFNDGAQHIIAGPGAVGQKIGGGALPTAPVSAAVVAAVHPPRGTPQTLVPNLYWTSPAQTKP